MSKLTMSALEVAVDQKAILRGIDLVVNSSEVHAIMGPNGSGKSTLAYTLAGHPSYEVVGSKSRVELDGENILEMSPDERAQAGVFLAFQYPMEIPGVKVLSFLRQAHQARFAHQPEKLFKSALEFRKHVEKLAAELEVKPELLKRGLNEGFSGGEKKRLEILQMAVLEPSIAILDETDSGLDVDAIQAVARGVNKIREMYQTGIIVITHYQRILQFLTPTHVHILKDGVISQSGGPELISQVETAGYKDL